MKDFPVQPLSLTSGKIKICMNKNSNSVQFLLNFVIMCSWSIRLEKKVFEQTAEQDGIELD